MNAIQVGAQFDDRDRREAGRRVELGFPIYDARVLYPDAVERLYADEYERLTAHLLEQQGAAS